MRRCTREGVEWSRHVLDRVTHDALELRCAGGGLLDVVACLRALGATRLETSALAHLREPVRLPPEVTALGAHLRATYADAPRHAVARRGER